MIRNETMKNSAEQSAEFFSSLFSCKIKSVYRDVVILYGFLQNENHGIGNAKGNESHK